MLASAEARCPFGYFSFGAAETVDRFAQPLSPDDCSELMNCQLNKLNWVSNTYAWMVSNDTKSIRVNALDVGGLLRTSVWRPSGESIGDFWKPPNNHFLHFWTTPQLSSVSIFRLTAESRPED